MATHFGSRIRDARTGGEREFVRALALLEANRVSAISVGDLREAAIVASADAVSDRQLAGYEADGVSHSGAGPAAVGYRLGHASGCAPEQAVISAEGLPDGS